MERKKIIELAREAHFTEPTHPFNPWSVSVDDLERFATLIEQEVSGGVSAEQTTVQWWDGEGNLKNLVWDASASVTFDTWLDNKLVIDPTFNASLDCHTTFIGNDDIEVLRISKEGIWVNPDVPVDDAAKSVLSALDGHIKKMVEKAVAEVCGGAEPVMWYTEDHLTDWSATTRNGDVAERWRLKGWSVSNLYTHPAPTLVRQLVEALRMVLDDPDALDGRPRTYECVQKALTAAKEVGL